MTDSKKGIQDFPAYDRNPIVIDGIYDRESRKVPGERIVVDEETGEVFAMKPAIKSGGKFYKDHRSYRKVYVETLKEVKDLSVPAFRILCFILYTMIKDTDEVRIHPAQVMNFCGYKSMTQYYMGILDLLNKKFIFRKVDDKTAYFINVNVFFNGNRLKLMPEDDIEI